MGDNTTLVFAINLITVLLAVAGFIGSLLPVVPGPVLILAGAILHRIFLWEDSTVSWTVIILLVLGCILAAVVDFLATMLGAKKFGATKWGIWGALIGAVVGFFIGFGLPGLIIGPVIGAVAGEMLSGKKWEEAGKAGFGTIVGNLLGMIGKVAIAAVMMSLLIFDVYWLPIW